MKKNVCRKTLCCLLACLLAVAGVFFAFAGTRAEDAHLHFDAYGKFRILNFSDFQDDISLNSTTKAFIRRSIMIAQPDLIVLTGDNIYGPDIDSSSDTQPAIAQFMDIFKYYGVPVAIVFGNHDDDDGTILNRGKPLSKERQMEIYNSYSVDISCDPVPSLSGCGTYNIPIYGSTENDKVKFNLWMIDTGSDGPGALKYDGMRQDQVNWYISKSNELKAANGGVPVPSIAFQHIIVPEIYDALIKKGSSYYLPSDAAPGSILGEDPCPSADNRYYNEFSRMKDQGDVIAIVCGHDHTNMFVVPYQGIDLICTPTAGFYSEYGYSGESRSRGARVIDIDEQTGTYTTHMINLAQSEQPYYYVQQPSVKYVKDVALSYSGVAHCNDDWDLAHDSAYGQLYDAVDAANGNGAAIDMDLNAGDVTPEPSFGEHYFVFMGYTYTDDPNEAMRGFGLFNPPSDSNAALSGLDGTVVDDNVWRLCNSGDHLVSGTFGPCNLNRGTAGEPLFFAAAYNSAAGSPITDIRIVNTGSEPISMDDYPGYELAHIIQGEHVGSQYADLNMSAAGDYIYALYRSNIPATTRTSLGLDTLRSKCFEAARLLNSIDRNNYTPDSWQALYDVILQTRSGILADVDDDHETTVYDQSAINRQRDAIQSAVDALTLTGKVRVTFDANGGTCSVQTREYTVGTSVGTLPTATRPHYVMAGWYTASDGGTKILERTVITEPAEQTWYAHWMADGSWIAGDADGDGECGVCDVMLIARYIAGGWNVHPDIDHADVNGDGAVDLQDVVLLRRYIVGGWGVELA
ncbi:MAG: InlB B-repeat-containing protein [Clostridia bacterium]|nr:InlB B-repeat-containing protein [Clostridia bacterium]